MDSVKAANKRLWNLYPKVLVTCSSEAISYANCVTQNMAEVRKGQCDAEFQKFKICLQKSAKKHGGKLWKNSV